MKKYLLCMFLILGISNVYSSVEISEINFTKNNTQGILSIPFKGQLKDYPELNISGKSIQVLIPNSKIKNTIEKAVSFSSTLIDTQLRAYQTTKNDSKIKAMLAFNIEKIKDKVALTIRDNSIELTFPRQSVKLSKAPELNSIIKKEKVIVKKESLDEDYLNSLIKVEKPVEKAVSANTNQKKVEIKDNVSSKMAASIPAGSRTPGKSISLIEYGGKFVAFLGLMLLMFFGLITLMKKGFIKKGKLGFFNNTDQIVVLNQTYIAPKKSLMLIKAHNQVFLVSNTDSGIHHISEIKDAAGLLKDGEKSLTGHNFDTNLEVEERVNISGNQVKIKEDISVSNQASSLSAYKDIADKVKFSDQLKKKVKGLKPLQ